MIVDTIEDASIGCRPEACDGLRGRSPASPCV